MCIRDSPSSVPIEAPAPEPQSSDPPTEIPIEPKEGEVRLYHGDRGGSYRALFADHLQGSKKIRVEDPYIRSHYQVVNFLRFCELCVEIGSVEEITLVTAYESEYEKQ